MHDGRLFCQIHMKEFNTEEALREISRYVFKYYDDVSLPDVTAVCCHGNLVNDAILRYSLHKLCWRMNSAGETDSLKDWTPYTEEASLLEPS